MVKSGLIKLLVMLVIGVIIGYAIAYSDVPKPYTSDEAIKYMEELISDFPPTIYGNSMLSPFMTIDKTKNYYFIAKPVSTSILKSIITGICSEMDWNNTHLNLGDATKESCNIFCGGEK